MFVVVFSWLMRVARFLRLQCDTTLLIRLNRDCFVVDEAGMLLRVLVYEVERVSRELDSSVGVRLD